MFKIFAFFLLTSPGLLAATESANNIDPLNVSFSFYRKHGEIVAISPQNSSDYLRELFEHAATKVLLPDWKCYKNCSMFKRLGNAFTDVMSVNVMLVEWSKNPQESITTYPNSVRLVMMVASRVSQMLNHLVAADAIQLDNVHILGHGVGAHAAGATGNKIKFGKIGRITGLDPAAKGFDELLPNGENDCTRGLGIGDATFVDVVHTTGGTVGCYDPIGDVDFYPNSGRHPQPHCGLEDYKCSHDMATEYYRLGLYNRDLFEGKECSDWITYLTDQCKNHLTIPFGEDTSIEARGSFFFMVDF